MYEMNKTPSTAKEVVALLRDILGRRGSESYLGEAVTMSEHMLQTAWIAEQAQENPSVIVAALLHDIGHYTSEFGDDYLELGVDNLHEVTGEKILRSWFPPEVCEVVRWHVDAKRYLCATESDYLSGLSEASVRSLELQGGPMNQHEVRAFENNPWIDTIVRVRRYDDGGKVPGRNTPDLEHYLEMVESVLLQYQQSA